MLMLWLRTLVFTIFVPGTELVLIPFLLVSSGVGPHPDFGRARYTGLALILTGLLVVLYCFANFIRRGNGTPAPYDPPRTLVIVGFYCYVRNPQYVGVVFVAVGEGLLTETAILFGYALLLATAFHLLIKYYEEPTLKRLYGEAYDRYCKDVPRWIPRMQRIYNDIGSNG